MKIICAWCKKLLGYKCPLCGATLVQDPDNKSQLLCESGATAIHFGLENMPESHGICEECRADLKKLTPEEKANAEAERHIAALDGKGNRGEQ